MFTKNNIDYRNPNNKDDNLEEFTIKNMDTENLKAEDHIKTKSQILAPFNTSAGESKFMDDSLETSNNIALFKGKARELNKNYELNNNYEIDNGMIISPNGNTFNSLNNKSFELDSKLKVSTVKGNKSNYASGLTSPQSEYLQYKSGSDFNFDEEIINQVSLFGYSHNFIKRNLATNSLNYATACYYLMNKNE